MKNAYKYKKKGKKKTQSEEEKIAAMFGEGT